jgi:DNA repair protein RecO (recombination protein O)
MSAISKGSRRSTSHLRGASDILTCAKFSIATGKSSLKIVSQAEVKHSFPILRNDLFRLAHAQYMAEMVGFFALDDDPHPETFSLLRVSLLLLERVSDPEIASRWFELRLMDQLGYALSLENCPICGEAIDLTAVLSQKKIAFSTELGGALCAKHESETPSAKLIMLPIESLRHLERLNSIELENVKEALKEPVPSQQIGAQARLALSLFLREHLETELKSAKFLDSLRPRGGFLTREQ